MLRPFLTIAIAFVAFGCKQKKSSAVSTHLQTMDVVSRAPISLQLPMANDNHFVAEKLSYGLDAATQIPIKDSLSITFPNLTEKGRKSISAHFRSRSIPKEKSPSLQDFLPPAIHAVLGTRFVIETYYDEALPKTEDKLYSFITAQSNCFAAVYEFLRNGRDEYAIFFADARYVQKIFENKIYSDVVTSTRAESHTSNASLWKNLQYGDALLAYLGTGKERRLAHAAIYIDGDVYFEKTGSADEFMYRFVTLEDIRKDYPKAEFVFRRFGKAPLPSPYTAFSVAHTDPSLAKTLPPNISQKTSLVKMTEESGEKLYIFTPIVSYRYVKDSGSEKLRLPDMAFERLEGFER